MFRNPIAYIPLLSLVCYSVLLAIVVRRLGRDRVRRSFSVYLATMILWSFASFLMHANVGLLSPLGWNRLVVLGNTAMPITVFSFVRVFVGKDRSALLVAGVLSLVVTQILNFLGLVVQSADMRAGVLVIQYGPGLIVTGVSWLLFIGLSTFDLLREMVRTQDIVYRNRIRYLLVVIALMVAGSLTNATALQSYPVDVGFNAIGAILILYAIQRHQLLDITVVVRRGLLYSIPTIVLGVSYFLVIFLLTRLFHSIGGRELFVLSLAVAIVAAVAAQPLRDRAQLWIDRLFFREKYDAGLMIQRLSAITASILDLDLLTRTILDEVSRGIHIGRVALYVRQEDERSFRLMGQRGWDEVAPSPFASDHPVVLWLGRNEILTRYDIEVMPQFKALWGEERGLLERMAPELVLPLTVKGELVGLFFIGPRLSERRYSQDDRLTLATLANQTAVAIENARLYWELQNTLNELRQARADLERRVTERTAQLAEANVALQAEVKERTRAEEQITASLHEKEILLREIHHRVKNNLQIISSLLFLQAQGLKDQSSAQTLRESQNRVRSMSLVHEMLYRSTDLSRIGFGEYVRNLVRYLFGAFGARQELGFEVNVEDVSLDINTAIPCGLIINELVSNALKHAFPGERSGTIRIEVRPLDAERFLLTVSDDGLGFPANVDPSATASLGLQLVNTLVRQLDGTLELDRAPGTRFSLTLRREGAPDPSREGPRVPA